MRTVMLMVMLLFMLMRTVQLCGFYNIICGFPTSGMSQWWTDQVDKDTSGSIKVRIPDRRSVRVIILVLLKLQNGRMEMVNLEKSFGSPGDPRPDE